MISHHTMRFLCHHVVLILSDKYIYVIFKEKLEEQIGMVFKQENSPEFINVT